MQHALAKRCQGSWIRFVQQSLRDAMNRPDIEARIDEADHEACAAALKDLLAPHAAPVFGAAKVVEHEVAAFRALQRLGYLPTQPDEYGLVMALHATKAKARSLLYQAALRNTLSKHEGDDALRQLLRQPRVIKEGNKAIFDVAYALMMNYSCQ